MLVTVTGASGFLGGNLIRALIAQGRPGLRVRALVRGTADDLAGSGLAGLPVETLAGDICDAGFVRGAVAGSEVVYHLAALISLQARDEALMRRVNVGGTRAVLDACRDAGVRRVVYFSSIHAFSTEAPGTVDEAFPLADEDRHAPAYDRTKAAALRVARESARAGLDVVSVHPTGVIGPYDYRPSHTGELVLDLARGRLPALVTGGFDFVDARDVVAGALAAEARGRRGESYLLGGEWVSIADLAQMVTRAGGARPPRVNTPMLVARGAAPFVVALCNAIGVRPLYTPASLHALRTHRFISHARAERELAYAPRPMAETVADLVAWFRERGALQRGAAALRSVGA